jgi:TolB-like protein
MNAMRSLSKYFALFLALVAIFAFGTTATAQMSEEPAGRVVLVLPFDNHSGDASLNWIGDSFPDTLDKRLDSAGFLTISHDDRAFAYDHMGLPVDFRPTRATTIRIAQLLDANYVIIGSFNVVSGRIQIQAKVLSVDTLKLSPAVEDSAELAIHTLRCRNRRFLRLRGRFRCRRSRTIFAEQLRGRMRNG